jgi:hypothetical protein
MLPGIFELNQAVDRFCHLQLHAELGGQLSRKLAAIECVSTVMHISQEVGMYCLAHLYMSVSALFFCSTMQKGHHLPTDIQVLCILQC